MQSFDDNFKLNLYMNSNSKMSDIWLRVRNKSLINSKKLNNNDECLIKQANSLLYENCNKNLQFFCEFNIETASNNKIKVSCGQSRIKSTTTTTTTTTTTVTTKTIIFELKQQIINNTEITTRATETKASFNTSNFGMKTIFNSFDLYLLLLLFICHFLFYSHNYWCSQRYINCYNNYKCIFNMELL